MKNEIHSEIERNQLENQVDTNMEISRRKNINTEEPSSDKESNDPLLENNMEDIAASHAERINQRKQYLFPVIIAQVIGVLALVLVLIWCVKYLGGFNLNDQVFNLHPFLMILSLIYLFGNSIIVYRVFWQYDKYKIKLVHSILNLIAFLLAIFGLYAAFESHNIKNIPNLYSLHSWIGIITVILFGIQLFGGTFAFLIPVMSVAMRKFILPYHVFFGMTIFVGAMVATISGLNEKAFFALGSHYGDRTPSAYVINFIGLSVLLFGGFVVFLATREGFRRPSNPEESSIYRHQETQFQ